MMTRKKKDDEKKDETTEPTKADKLKGLLKKLKGNKQLSGAKIYLASDEEAQLKTISFGIPALDTLCKGQLLGGYTVLYGAEKAGKSTIMLRAIAQMQRDGLEPVLLDLEERFDPNWAAIQGVDVANLYVVSGALDLEEALTIVEEGVRDGIFTAVAVDSIQAKSARGELQDKKGKARGLDEDTMAAMARLLSKWFRRMGALTKSKQVPVLLLAQVRTSGMSVGGYLDITGGLALKHYASTILYIGRTEKVAMTKQGEKVELGYWVKAVLKKTSLCANEGKECRIPFYFGVGVEDSAAAVRSGMNLGIVINHTRGVEFNEKKYPSEASFVEKLRANKDLRNELFQAVAAASSDVIDDSTHTDGETIDITTGEVLGSNSNPVRENEIKLDGNNNTNRPPTTDVQRTTDLAVDTETPSDNTCGDCKKEFKSATGLKTHKTRMH
jgi:recombination protein RecA